MPTYVFTCASCGEFELLRPMVQAGSTAACPACEAPARRVFTPPGLSALAAPERRALDTEEASAHEPAVVSEKRGRPLPHRHGVTPPWAVGH